MATAATDECINELVREPDVIVDPDTGLLTEASADAIDATLPPWIRIDRAQPVADDGQIQAIFDLELAAMDPAGRALLGLDADNGT